MSVDETTDDGAAVHDKDPRRLMTFRSRARAVAAAASGAEVFLIWTGLGAAATGLLLLTYAWIRTANEAVVSEQLPHLVLGGCGGLGFIALGGITINIATKVHGTRRRIQQSEQWREHARELRSGTEER